MLVNQPMTIEAEDASASPIKAGTESKKVVFPMAILSPIQPAMQTQAPGTMNLVKIATASLKNVSTGASGEPAEIPAGWANAGVTAASIRNTAHIRVHARSRLLLLLIRDIVILLSVG